MIIYIIFQILNQIDAPFKDMEKEVMFLVVMIKHPLPNLIKYQVYSNIILNIIKDILF